MNWPKKSFSAIGLFFLSLPLHPGITINRYSTLNQYGQTEEIASPLLELIEQESDEILTNVYFFNSSIILNSMHRAADRGVKIIVVVDKDSIGSICQFATSTGIGGIQFAALKALVSHQNVLFLCKHLYAGKLHKKQSIFGRKVVAHGSANYTDKALGIKTKVDIEQSIRVSKGNAETLIIERVGNNGFCDCKNCTDLLSFYFNDTILNILNTEIGKVLKITPEILDILAKYLESKKLEDSHDCNHGFINALFQTSSNPVSPSIEIFNHLIFSSSLHHSQMLYEGLPEEFKNYLRIRSEELLIRKIDHQTDICLPGPKIRDSEFCIRLQELYLKKQTPLIRERTSIARTALRGIRAIVRH